MRKHQLYHNPWILGSVVASLTIVSAWTQGGMVAVIDGKPVEARDLDKWLGDKLLRLRTEEYSIRLATLNEHLDQMVLSQEADKRGISVADLLMHEVTEATTPVTRAEALAVFDSSAKVNERVAGDEDVKTTMDQLRVRRLARRRTEFIASLREQHRIQIKVEPPRLVNPILGGQSRGDPAASVAIVAFSDFQCPYCADLDSTLRRLEQHFGRDLRITFKQFPLSAHRQAEEAAEAALCASEQKRYWEMGGMLFGSQRAVAERSFGELARQAGLDLEAFQQCMASHRTAAEVFRDVADARTLGVNSTPTLFVNGLLVTGAKPYDELQRIVDAEIRRAKEDSSVKKPGDARKPSQ